MQALTGIPLVEQWSITDHLLALQVDYLAMGNWQRGGGHGPRPRPIRRPGVGDEEQHLRGDVLPPDEYGAELARRYRDD